MELRLATPLNSYTTPVGSAFEAALISPCKIGQRILLPSKTVVFGKVTRRTQVGIGLIHERAGLDFQFDEFQLPDGRRFKMRGRLLAIENARETVNNRGHIQGVLAADNPQHWFDGMWERPSVFVLQRSLMGLTGILNRISEGLSIGPWGAAALIAFRVSVFDLPEPEIRLPVGAELRVALTDLPEGSPRLQPSADTPVPEDLLENAGEQAFSVAKPDGKDSGDLINIGLFGSQEQVLRAFEGAGWTEATARSVRSFSRFWQAYASQTGYADAPASRLFYLGEQPEFVFQKSFNTVAMRHHVRLWRSEIGGREVWLGAATHDVAFGFDAARMVFTHKIERNIDWERDKLIGDLIYAGCTDGIGLADRPSAVRFGASQNGIVSDGRIAVATLRDCAAIPSSPDPEMAKPARSVSVRTARRAILETRNYLLRENPYYWGYRLWRWEHGHSEVLAFTH